MGGSRNFPAFLAVLFGRLDISVQDGSSLIGRSRKFFQES